MKWTLKLVSEVVPGKPTEYEVAMIERIEKFSPATVGLTINEGKAILAGLQKQMVTAQVQHHGASIHSCPGCGKAFRTKGYYKSTLRSVYGNVGMRIRRLRGCSCVGARQNSFSAMFTNKDPTTPELKYLTAKLAALLPFGKVADFLGELLPLSAQTTPNTIRNRTMKVGRRLQRSAEALAVPLREAPCEEVIVGLDGGYVRSRHPHYGNRYRDRLRISTGFVESTVNEIIAKRMVKKQQMRWSRHTVQAFLNVRVHVLNATLEDAFRHWHRGFRPLVDLLQPAAAA